MQELSIESRENWESTATRPITDIAQMIIIIII
jgi:hypothetical protein